MRVKQEGAWGPRELLLPLKCLKHSVLAQESIALPPSPPSMVGDKKSLRLQEGISGQKPNITEQTWGGN